MNFSEHRMYFTFHSHLNLIKELFFFWTENKDIVIDYLPLVVCFDSASYFHVGRRCIGKRIMEEKWEKSIFRFYFHLASSYFIQFSTVIWTECNTLFVLVAHVLLYLCEKMYEEMTLFWSGCDFYVNIKDVLFCDCPTFLLHQKLSP